MNHGGMSNAAQTPGILNIGFRRGDEFRRIVSVNVDLTGYTLAWQVFGLADRLTKIEGSLAFTTPPHAVGLVITEAQTGTLQPGTYGFRAVWVATGSVTRTFLEGVCEVTR